MLLLEAKLEPAVVVGLGRDRPACLKGSEVRSRLGGARWKREDRKVLARASSTSEKAVGGEQVTR